MLDTALPGPALRRFVRYYYQVESLLDLAVVQPVPARSPQAIEFTFGAPYEVHRLAPDVREQAHPVALIGAQTFHRVDLTMRGTVNAFTVVFRPGGIAALFRVPANVLTNDHFEASGVLGARIHDLHQRLGQTPSFRTRAQIADEFFIRLALAAPHVDPIMRAARTVLARDGCVKIANLADGSGLGLRQFERRFEATTGVAPKLYSRIVRFEAALRIKAASAGLRWTDVAHALGYHDQMHMVHDFNRLAGTTPSAIAHQLDMFVQPEVHANGGRGPDE